MGIAVAIAVLTVPVVDDVTKLAVVSEMKNSFLLKLCTWMTRCQVSDAGDDCSCAH